MLLIVIITFLKIGTGDAIAQNNAFFCILLLVGLFWLQIQYKPFLTEDLNQFNDLTAIIMILTIFLGVFSTVSKDLQLQTIILTMIIFINTYFLLVSIKKIFILKISMDDSSTMIKYIRKNAESIWRKGLEYFHN